MDYPSCIIYIKNTPIHEQKDKKAQEPRKVASHQKKAVGVRQSLRKSERAR